MDCSKRCTDEVTCVDAKRTVVVGSGVNCMLRTGVGKRSAARKRVHSGRGGILEGVDRRKKLFAVASSTGYARVVHRISTAAFVRRRATLEMFMKRSVPAAILAAVLLAPAGVRAADDATLLRVFLTDGSSIVSYGEPARAGDRIVFSMPTPAVPD